MSPSNVVVLPESVSSELLNIGQLLSNPLSPSTASFPSYSPSKKDVLSETMDAASLTPAGQASTYRALKSPEAVFESICQDASAQDWLRQSVTSGPQPVYFVVGLQESPCASGASTPRQSEATTETLQRPPPVLRRDSGLGNTNANSSHQVLGVEVRKVQVRIGRPDEPHSIEDLKWSWTYYPIPPATKMDEEMQLAIGLGSLTNLDEMRPVISA